MIKYFSFDIFDTLIARLCSKPTDVFMIVEEIARAEGIFADGFYENRIKAEIMTRKNHTGEITLNEIYITLNEIEKKYDIARLVDIEVKTEIGLSFRRTSGYRAYCDVFNFSGSVIYITDMYLPRGVIYKILEKNNYSAKNKLYLSCEHNKTKHQGDLFSYVIKDLNTLPNEIKHVGDNFVSDFLMAQKKGLKARWYPLIVKCRKTNLSNIGSLIANRLIKQNIIHNSVIEEIGYSGLGPILTGFSLWLKKRIDEDGISTVLFLSRDGYILKKTFDIFGFEQIKTKYFFASRRALLVPNLWWKSGLKEMLESILMPKVDSIENILIRLGMDKCVVNKKLIQIGIDPDIRIETKMAYADERINVIYNIYKNEIIENSKKEFEVLIKYCQQERVCGKIGLVDIGWYGNMQLALSEALKKGGIDAEIHGYYVGLNPFGNNQKKYNMQGYLFDKTENFYSFVKIHGFTAIFEMFFTADHGSLKKYYYSEGEVKPILANRTDGEKKSFEFVRKVQTGAIKFVEDYCSTYVGKYSQISPKVAIRQLCKLCCVPTYDNAVLLGNLSFEENSSVIQIAVPKKNKLYLLKPSQLWIDAKKTMWISGFVKRVFYINFPIDIIRFVIYKFRMLKIHY